jgi:hypothetical protein
MTRLTERDVRILVKCAICRWLTTEQIKRLYFPEATLNAVQKRLRKLADSGFLRSHREHPTAEAIHAVGPKGKHLVEEKGIEVALQAEVPSQLGHLLGINEIRVAVETSKVRISWFFAYWQLGELGWTHRTIPDAVFAVRDPERRTFLVEYDRGTETLTKLFEKLRSYNHGLDGFSFKAVLLVMERTRRLDLLSRALRRKDLSLGVLAVAMEQVRGADLFGCELVELPGGGKRKLLTPAREDDER